MARGTIRKGVDAAAAAPPRVTLLSLPDEILALVFAALHGRYQYHKTGMPPTQYLQICKRLYAIARPIWFSVLVVSKAKTDEYCAKMLEHAAALTHARDLQLQLEADPPAWKLALFPHLANLQTLRLREAPVPRRQQAGESYSDKVMIALENVVNLSNVHVLSSDTTLFSSSDNPIIIRRLDLPISSQVTLGIRMLEHLTLRIDSDSDATDCEYEWDELEAIEFVVDPKLSETPQLFLRKLLMQTGRTANFERLRRFKILLLRSGPADVDICESLLAAFSRAPITDLELDYGPFHPFPDSADVPWTSLTKLTLRASLKLTEPWRLSELFDLLRKSPDLRDLTLIDFDWMGVGEPNLIGIGDPNLVTTYTGFPALYTFIHLLRDSTAILRVCICRSTGNRVLRWNRLSPREEFQAEWYVVQR